MSRNIIGDERTRRSIVSVLRTVNDILPVSERLVFEVGSRKLTIKSGRKHVPDFLLKWADDSGYYLVYPVFAISDYREKVISNFSMMTIGDKLTAVEFVNMIQIILKNRNNKKS